MLYRYLSILIAAFLVVLGLQIPGFVNQYEQRVSAHLLEVEDNLARFQEIADRYHQGSLDALITHHRQSGDPTFVSEADAIAALYERYRRFSAELAELEASLIGRVIHVAFASDPELMEETVTHYTWVITLNRESAVCAALSSIVGIMLLDLVRGVILITVRRTT